MNVDIQPGRGADDCFDGLASPAQAHLPAVVQAALCRGTASSPGRPSLTARRHRSNLKGSTHRPTTNAITYPHRQMGGTAGSDRDSSSKAKRTAKNRL